MGFKKLSVNEPSKDFRKAAELTEVAEIPSPPENHVTIQNKYVGVNATDINIVNGGYGNTTTPFDIGLEAVGVVTEVGAGVTSVKAGDAVVYQSMGAFAEYKVAPAASLIKAPEASAKLLPITVCGISASIALEQIGELKSNETVLVTAAAGGTGQFVVQLAKEAGNHVIGTCSSDEKGEYLKSIGCDRVVNYNKEDLGEVLKKEYPNGVDITFETVGGKLFKDAVMNVAKKGRIITFGMISGYLERQSEYIIESPELVMQLIPKSASIRGFILFNHAEHIPSHITKLVEKVSNGTIKAGLDPTKFKGLEQIADAIDHMYAKKNIGKVVVEL